MNPIALRLHECGLTLEGTGLDEIVLSFGIAEREIIRLEDNIAALKAAHVDALARLSGDQLARDADMYNLAEEAKRLREALKHYADPKKWKEFEITCGEIFGGQDGDFAMAFDSPDDCPWSVAAEALNP